MNCARTLVAAGISAAIALTATSAHAQKRVKWKMQSAFTSTLSHLGTGGVRFSKNISRLSDDKFQLKFFEPGALVPALEAFDAVSKGSIESAWTTPGYHTGKYPALAYFTAVPFGPGYGEYFAWKMFGGGDELKQEIYAAHDLMSFDCFAIGPETSGWFKNEVQSLDDLKGMKMRFFGLGAKVMTRIGVSTQLLAGADIYPALERGVIDATEFSMPNMDINLGFYQIAKNNYFPGWHQQTSVSELLINRAAFSALPDAYKAMLEVGCGESVHYVYAETEGKNFGAMLEMQTKHNVVVRRWTDEQLAVFEKAWMEVDAEESAKDATWKRVSDSYKQFRAEYKVWGEAQALKPTYLK